MSDLQKIAISIGIGLLVICIALIILSDAVFGPVARAAVLPVATEGFKTVLAALVGAVSVMLGLARTTR
jgi:hypothetical protein